MGAVVHGAHLVDEHGALRARRVRHTLLHHVTATAPQRQGWDQWDGMGWDGRGNLEWELGMEMGNGNWEMGNREWELTMGAGKWE